MKIIKDSVRAMDVCAHGHTGAFKVDSKGVVLKKAVDTEVAAYIKVQKDPLRPFCPEYLGEGEINVEGGEKYLMLGNVTDGFESPVVMDCKVGTRTFLESECCSNKPRKDLFTKMMKLGDHLPSPDEKDRGEVTKLRYMTAREALSSTSVLGFRVDGVVGCEATVGVPLQFLRQEEDVRKVFETTLNEVSQYSLEVRNRLVMQVLSRLRSFSEALGNSPFFASHEMIGASILFVLDSTSANLWLIDLAKCIPLPPGIVTSHDIPWKEGNHEDGFVTGIENLILIWRSLIK
eukprot:TRINITY_DN21277_c0_g1_i1.p1 TRINITY_DN21277_c0_g1~~TRINITY_DN21277_c0_g1_i1.p1  ORF type:complete len:290 (+),score=47.79 TRINITY_DN21277_c0_g1_i1:86-955(+)